jgi:hypothetical protein
MATWPNLNAMQGRFTKQCSGYKGSVELARVMPLPYRRLTGRRFLVRTGIVELLTIVFIVFIIWPS